MIPCIKDKCILLPVCKHKDDITCDQLESYFVKLMKDLDFSFNKAFDKLTEILPSLYRMEGNERVFFNIQDKSGYDPEVWSNDYDTMYPE